MGVISERLRPRTALAACLAAVMAGAPSVAMADQQTVKLIQLLIQKGILTPGQAKDLLKETSGAAPASRKHAQAVAPADTGEEVAPAATPGQIRVTYVPEFVRKQIADQVRAQVMDQAQQEGWAAPDALPEWTKRIKIIGDLRMRYRADMFDNDNYNQFINFNSINNGSAFDANSYGVGSVAPPPFLNTTEDRQRFQLRARFGVQAEIDDWVTATIRAGTGQDDGPVSTNQTLGTATSSLGASGDFAKPALWLDRAYFTLTPLAGLTVYAGRMDNPFLPSDLMFYPDLGFDGIAANYTRDIGGGVSLFGTAGGFPLFNTSFDFSTNSDVKYASTNAYLAGAQAGAVWHINPQLQASLGVGIFDFLGVQGAVSAPCYVQPGTTFYCNTDATRAPYVQFGNTLYPIRNIVPYYSSTGATPPDPQYYGLASRFNVLDIHPQLKISTYDPIDIVLEGEFTKNLAYNRAAIVAHGAPNETPGPVNNLGNNGAYQGGDTAYMLKATLGELVMQKRWDWNVFLSYRYLQSDSTLDAIADSDFHEGGTNAQGYIVGGDLGIARNTWLTLRYMSAEVISGPHYGTDQIFLDLQTRF
jgi:hypothetical protein